MKEMFHLPKISKFHTHALLRLSVICNNCQFNSLFYPYFDGDPLVDGHEGVLHAHVRDPPHAVLGSEIRKTRGKNFERSEPVSVTPVASHDTN